MRRCHGERPDSNRRPRPLQGKPRASARDADRYCQGVIALFHLSYASMSSSLQGKSRRHDRTWRAPHGSRVTICEPGTPAGRRLFPVLLTSLVKEPHFHAGVRCNGNRPAWLGAQAGRWISHPVGELWRYVSSPQPSRPALLLASLRVFAGADVHTLPATRPARARSRANAWMASGCRKADEVVTRILISIWASPAGSVSWFPKHESRHR